MFLPRRSRCPAPGLALALFLALSALIAAPGAAPAQVFNPETATLANGMQVVVVTNRRAPVVTHMVWYRVGAIDEPAGKSGLAHLLEHLMFKGTNTLQPGEFSAIVSRNGGQENAFTSTDYTGYWQSVAVDRLETMMTIEADRMANLVLKPEVVAPEVLVVMEERRSRVENEPGAQLREKANAALFLNHPYRLPIIGWEHEIAGLTPQDALAFYQAWYAPNNAILVVAGDVTMADVLPLAEKTYGQIPAHDLPARIDWREPPNKADALVTLSDPKVTTPSWSRSYQAPSYLYGEIEHAYALQVLAEILSGGPTARLNKALVVDQPIASSAGAWYDPDRRGPGQFGFYVSPRDGADVSGAATALQAEIARLLKDGVTQEEVDRAKRAMQDAAILARDSLVAPARALGSALAIGLKVEDVEDWPNRIGAVTVEEVNAAARAVLDGAASVTSILKPGDHK